MSKQMLENLPAVLARLAEERHAARTDDVESDMALIGATAFHIGGHDAMLALLYEAMDYSSIPLKVQCQIDASWDGIGTWVK